MKKLLYLLLTLCVLALFTAMAYAVEQTTGQTALEQAQSIIDLIKVWGTITAIVLSAITGIALRFGLIKKKDATNAYDLLNLAKEATDVAESTLKEVAQVMEKVSVKNKHFLKKAEELKNDNAKAFIMKNLDTNL